MRPKPSKVDRKHPEAARDAMNDIRELSGDTKPVFSDIRYVNANRDRTLGEADRTGRHFDEEARKAPDEGSEASNDQLSRSTRAWATRTGQPLPRCRASVRARRAGSGPADNGVHGRS